MDIIKNGVKDTPVEPSLEIRNKIQSTVSVITFFFFFIFFFPIKHYISDNVICMPENVGFFISKLLNF